MMWIPSRCLVVCVLTLLLLAPDLAAQTQSVTGRLMVVWDGASGGSEPALVLTNDRGVSWRLELDAAMLRSLGPINRLAGQRVQADLGTGPALPGAAQRTARVRSIVPLAASGAQRSSPPAVGAAPWITLLCKFADVPTYEPLSPAQVGVVMGTTYPGVADFYRELSGGVADLSGDSVAGWFLLPAPRSTYVVQNIVDFNRLLRDCTAAGDSLIDFKRYYGVNLGFNQPLDVRTVPPYDQLSHGGQSGLSIDGVNRVFGVTWLAYLHLQNYVVVTHEMGHGFGWPHSSGPYAQTYDSRWDVMSFGYLYSNPAFGYLGVHTVAYHKYLAGWYGPGEIYVARGQDSTGLTIERSALAPPGNVRMVRLPLRAEPGKYYTVEARRQVGYDLGVPGDAVIIHKVDSTLTDRQAQVVDVDNNGDPNDSGAMWLPGEVFRDSSNDVVMAVVGSTATGYQIELEVGNTLTLFAAGRSRSDSVLVGSTTQLADSARLTLQGRNSGATGWTASHGAGRWLTISTPSGVASGAIHWTRNPSELTIGNYVDTISVTAIGAVGSPQRIIDTLRVVEQSVNLACAEQALLTGATCLSPAERAYLDASGNNDQAYNLGDLLAYLDRKSLTLSPPARAALPSVAAHSALAAPPAAQRSTMRPGLSAARYATRTAASRPTTPPSGSPTWRRR